MDSSSTLGNRGNGDAGLETEWDPTLLASNWPVLVDNAKQFVKPILYLSLSLRLGGPNLISSKSGAVFVIPDSFKWIILAMIILAMAHQFRCPNIHCLRYHTIPSMCTSRTITNLFNAVFK